MTLDVGILRDQIIDSAVTAVNATAEDAADIARQKVPIRKVFKGGRQTVRFKTADEIERDRGLRAKLGLAPEILATPEAVARVRAGKINPKSSTRIGGEEFGFARTVEHAGRIHTVHRDIAGQHTNTSHQDRPRNFQNRANRSLQQRLMREGYGGQGRLKSEAAEGRLTARGRYELKTERAVSRRLVAADTTAVLTGDIRGGGSLKVIETRFRHGPPKLGGALHDSIHVERASAGDFPNIKASIVAGGEDAPYAKFQELGTRHNPAHPFLRPALAAVKDALPGNVVRALRRTLGGSRR